ncbi:hypothetical protein [Mycolicibacterium helvum]|uniref:Uncharacterized protein n=1 Tax=Mycolicibacterium helvum TaxID=1534349 RepID=A0A7I7TEX1_9MYCO|nr:hypothetical protein [Mycolicibacterium helvum]BBY67767.1 hypothetical protein MHEL_60100 [Mycolicibacterium helvum]
MTAPARPVPDVAAAEAVAVLMTEVSEGTLTAATMADRAVQRCREVFGQCDGPTDPLWPVHVDLCRAVLGHSGLPAGELAQWLSVARNRENPGGAGTYSPASVSSLSGARSPDSHDAEPDAGAELKRVAPQIDTVDTTDNDEFADVPEEVLAQAEAAALAVIDRYRRRQREGETDAR